MRFQLAKVWLTWQIGVGLFTSLSETATAGQLSVPKNAARNTPATEATLFAVPHSKSAPALVSTSISRPVSLHDLYLTGELRLGDGIVACHGRGTSPCQCS